MVFREAALDSIRPASYKSNWATILKRVDADEYFPIYVSAANADIIRNELIHDQANKPGEKSLVVEDISGYYLKFLLIDEWEENIRARLFFEKGDSKMEIECPVTGAIALAIRRDARIYAGENCFCISITDPFLQSLLTQ